MMKALTRLRKIHTYIKIKIQLYICKCPHHELMVHAYHLKKIKSNRPINSIAISLNLFEFSFSKLKIVRILLIVSRILYILYFKIIYFGKTTKLFPRPTISK